MSCSSTYHHLKFTTYFLSKRLYMNAIHTFHIPVMGIGYTIDTPLKVAQYGINSVISLVDDILLEKLRKMHSQTFKIPYQEITDKMEDYRAKRITSYLNLMHDLVEKKFEALKQVSTDTMEVLQTYINMLPEHSSLKEDFKKLTSGDYGFNEIKKWVNENLRAGSIDVNIMTKVDKDNYVKNEKLPVEY